MAVWQVLIHGVLKTSTNPGIGSLRSLDTHMQYCSMPGHGSKSLQTGSSRVASAVARASCKNIIWYLEWHSQRSFPSSGTFSQHVRVSLRTCGRGPNAKRRIFCTMSSRNIPHARVHASPGPVHNSKTAQPKKGMTSPSFTLHLPCSFTPVRAPLNPP